jgi:hypothetical protein
MGGGLLIDGIVNRGTTVCVYIYALATYKIAQTFSGYYSHCKLLQFADCWNKMHIKYFPDPTVYMHDK